MKPVLLHYYITNRCNARCTFCDIWQETPKQDALKDDVITNVAAARTAGCRFVDFTGGEPLLHPDLPLFLKEAKKCGLITSVTTNCLLFKERVHELAGLIDLLHFSLDGDTRHVHDEIRGVASFDRVLECIPLAKKNQLYPDLLFTYTNQNINSFEGVYALGRTHKCVVILDPVFNVDGADLVSPETHSQALAFARRPGVYLNKAHIALRTLGGNSVDIPVCKAVSSTIVILPDNSLCLPCYHHKKSTLPIANNASNLMQSAERRTALLQQGRYPFCDGCHINCYFDPSFTVQLNKLGWQSLLSKINYFFYKYVIYRNRLP